MRALVQTLTVAVKEIRELLSRPWQAFTLIAGPLAVMISFGLGSDTSANPPRAIVVVPPGQERPRLLRDYQRQFDQYLDVVDYTDNLEDARDRLSRGMVEAVVVLPETPFETIAGGEKATIRVFYNDINPLWRWVVPNFTQVMAGELNREIFVQTITEQLDALNVAARDVEEILRLLQLATDAADVGDRVEAQRYVREALQQSDELEPTFRDLGPQADPLREGLQQLQSSLAAVDQRLALTPMISETPDNRPLKEQLGLIDTTQRVRQLADTLERFTSVSPDVIISPLQVDARNTVQFEPDILSFFGPGVLALLIQHMAVSICSLAFVRERLGGGFDLYSIAPLSNLQLLIGKYAAYILFTLVIELGVLAVLIVGLHVPLLGQAWLLGAALVLLSVSCVGMGLALSLLATSERQAVQFAMLVLLAVFFFSGFTLPLRLLLPIGRAISYMLPATYGISLLQDIMLRGTSGRPLFFGILAVMSVGLFVVCFFLLRWRMRPQ